jgi:hypothetical protein
MADYSQVDDLISQYRFVNFGAESTAAMREGSKVDVLVSRYKSANFRGKLCAWQSARSGLFGTFGLADYPQSDALISQFKSVNFGAESTVAEREVGFADYAKVDVFDTDSSTLGRNLL